MMCSHRPVESNIAGNEVSERDALSEPQAQLRPNPFRIRDGFLVKETKSQKGPNKQEIISKYMEISNILQDIDTNKVLLELSYSYRGKKYKKEINRGMLTRSRILTLLDEGVDVNEKNALDVLEYINLQEDQAPLKLVHSNVGFQRHEDKLIYKHWRAIGLDSIYRGELAIEPKGTYDAWIKLIDSEVMGHTPLELALVLGLSAPVASIVAEETGMEVIVVHIYGNSSQGKTTALQLAISPFGLPNSKKSGSLLKDWNGTQNAIIGHFKDKRGVPMALDEASTRDGDFSKIVYLLASGKDKDRMNKEGDIKESSEWDGVILSNAEHSLKSKSKQNIGIQMRLFEVGNLNWTKTADNSNALKEGVLKNNGHAGPLFVEYLLNFGTDNVIEKWKTWREKVIENIHNPDEFSTRLSSKIAVFMTTAELAKDALNLPFNLAGILEVFLGLIDEGKEQRDIAQNAYEYFIDIYTRHHKNFSTQHLGEEGFELWGKHAKRTDGKQEICISPKVFKDKMFEGGFEDVGIILEIWRDRGWIDADKDKFTKKRNIQSKTSSRAYVIILQEDRFETEKADIKPKIRRKLSSNEKNRQCNLFENDLSGS
ncbi:DUF927 domain-containing protein [Halobacillus trueperi]|uniref:DUF927 domain-containing protein n=1 Tax=Halobacillus trueperi TaxID=156205 RepID=UPI003736EB03